MAGNSLTLSLFGKDISASKALKGVAKAGEKAASRLQSAGDKLTSAGKGLTMGVTLPLAGIATAAISTEKDFSKSMAQVGVATDSSGKTLTKLGAYAKKMGADTVFSAGEAADAMLELAKGGFTPAQIEGGALKSTMSLAAAGGLDLADAATLTSNAMHTFGLRTKDAGKIADALAGGANASSADVSDLGQALSQAGAAAKLTHQNMYDTVGALSAMADAGVKGSDAGTSLKTMLTRLVPSTKQAKAEMKQLGISFTNADGSIKKLPEVAQILHDKLSGLSEAQRTSALQTIFGTDAMRAASALYSNGKKGLEKYVSATKSQGNAQKMANAQMSGTAGALESMSGSVETAALSIGQALAPTVTKVANKIGQLADWFTKLSPDVKQTIVVIGGLVAAIGPALLIFGGLVTATGKTIAGFKAVGGVFKSASVAAKIAHAGFFDLRMGMAGMAEGAGGSVNAMSSLGLKIRTVSSRALSGVKALGSYAVSIAKAGVAATVTGAKLAAQTVRIIAARVATVAATVARGVATAAQYALNLALSLNPIGIVIALIAALVAAIVFVATKTTFFQQAWSAMCKGISTAWNWLWKSVIKPVINFIVAGFKTLVAAGKSMWTKGIKPALDSVGKAFTWLWNHSVKPVANFVSNAIGRIGSTTRRVFGGIAGFIRSAFQSVVSVVRGPVNAIIGLINSVVSGINSIHVTIPSWVPFVGGQRWGVHLPHIPYLAEGGVATSATLAMIGEGAEPEAVVPLSRLEQMMSPQPPADNHRDDGGNMTVVFHVYGNDDPEALSQKVARRLKRLRV